MPDLFASIDENRKLVVFTGNTYIYRDGLKSLGARWDSQVKTWTVFGVVTRETLVSLFPDIEIEVVPHSPGAFASASPQLGIPALNQGEDTAPNQSPLTSTPLSVSVAELISRVRTVLGSHFSAGFFIHGVITKARMQGSRVFVDLADSEERTTSVGCVIWDGANVILKPLVDAGYSLEPDLPVMFEVHLGLNNKGGQLSLRIARVVPDYTTGKLLAPRELTNRRLREEGLFDRNRELALPLLPIRLGILTSAGGTVINDFMASLGEGRFGFKLLWLPVSVQGKSAKNEIVRGLQTLASIETLDAILLFRGGGSPAELAIFNEYEIARAVCLCPRPVISAIGHQEDHSSTQDVSFRALGVPKDVGTYFAKIALDIRARLQLAGEGTKRIAFQLCDMKYSELLKTSHLLVARAGTVVERKNDVLKREIRLQPRQGKNAHNLARTALTTVGAPIPALARARVRHQFAGITQSGRAVAQQSKGLHREFALSLRRAGEMISGAVNGRLATSAEKISVAGLRMEDRADSLVERAVAGLKSHEAIIEAVRPEAQLRRGFALVHKEGDSAYIKRQGEVNANDTVVIEFQDGSRKAVIRS